MLNTLEIIQALWLVLAMVWVIGRLTGKRVTTRESSVAYLVRIVSLVVLFAFLFNPPFTPGWFGKRFVPVSHALDLAAIAMTATGVALAIWARLCLAGNWSGMVTLKEGHELIRRGPYGRIRHPIYAGLDLAFLVTALAIGQWRGLLAFVAAAMAHTMKARKEEAWLAREFGAAFEEHRRRTGMFLPRIV